jgi:hypothetical protein
VVSLLSWRNAVSVYQIWADQCADELDAFFNEVDGGTVQLQLVAPTDIAAKIEGPPSRTRMPISLIREPIATIAASSP